ncbi:NgoFVII family restriction endonuclease (plasmid) [Bacillus cereus]|uniref:restriction endonuclease PLD domain-containing protein n=1 Tax=Bacillus cereus group TaxID=86661 RepID=UPI000B442477|nr:MULTISPECIES: restriction endonuclease PLD domain-containing protein [Bacillus cereus group]OTW84066.1 restriction endonuclease [Bacillus thuringiensis serovar jinghongiensis]OTX19162.1 restriction endonuclease [Bacillus thuringiensis serovar japonensis]WBO70258.1 NgoFVII family restriction endonuclease [Bacillus cereus]
MKIINNLNSNHFNYIKEILVDADELHIISPFLMESFDIFFEEIKDMGLKKISLITTLKDDNLDLLKKSNSLHSFCFNCFNHAIDYKVLINNKLHGKIYISTQDGVPYQAIITSANFTEAGLGFNHEWGVQINDSNQIRKIIDELSNVSSHALNNEEISNIISRIDSYTNSLGETKKQKINLKVSDLIKKKVSVSKSDIRYFIKPVGWSDRPFSTNRSLGNDIEKLHFSKRRPAAVRIGDILICYAVGTTKLLGYYEVIEEPVFLKNADRWPWEVKAKNLSIEYSKRWNFFNNTISIIQSTYDSNESITFVGGKSLGALNFGADKIRLTEEFANHVINIIKNSR